MSDIFVFLVQFGTSVIIFNIFFYILFLLGSTSETSGLVDKVHICKTIVEVSELDI